MWCDLMGSAQNYEIGHCEAANVEQFAVASWTCLRIPSANSMGMHRPIVGFALAMLFFILFSSCSAQNATQLHWSPVELTAMDQLFSEWRKSTPDLDRNLPGWGQGKPCNPSKPWGGVRCLRKQWINDTSRLDVNIVHLVLQGVDLVGFMPPAIGNLSDLAALTIAENPNVTGPIPELDKCRSLYSIKMQGNSMYGAIPTTITSIPVLQYLDLSRNKLTGELPANLLSNITGLQTLNLSQNMLSGILNQTMFQDQSSLVELDFSKNNFSGLLPNLTSSFIYLDFSMNNFHGDLPNASRMENLQYLNLRNNQLGGEINLAMVFNVTSLTMLDLSYNEFVGSLPNLSSLTALESLDLSHNNFNPGLLPDWIMSLTHLQSVSLDNTSMYGSLNISKFDASTPVKSLSITNNNITDVAYTGFIKDLVTSFKLQGNPYCTMLTQKTDLKRCLCQQHCYDTEQLSKNHTKTIIIATTVSGSILGAIILFSALLLRKTRKKKYELLLEAERKFVEYEVKPTLYTYSELRVATKEFHPDMKLGEGGYGVVYKGILSNGDQVAVKQLFNTSAQKSIDDFLNEVVLVTAVKHRNLVKLKGCCLRRDQRLLVYEYIENYDVAQVLFEHKGNYVMDWPRRLSICLGVAHGLHYLHALAQPRIIHRDIKASNVLLDKNLQAKIADFGLALLFPEEQSSIMTMHVAGTRGYLAPEYATLGQLSEKADVYSYGILILEIVSGRRVIDLNLPPNQAYLLELAWRLHGESETLDLMDSSLCLHGDEEVEVQRVIKIALFCLQPIVERRPTMARVVAMLQGDIDLEIVGSRILSLKRFADLEADKPTGSDQSGIALLDIKSEASCRPLLVGSSSSGGKTAGRALDLSEIRPR